MRQVLRQEHIQMDNQYSSSSCDQTIEQKVRMSMDRVSTYEQLHFADYGNSGIFDTWYESNDN